LAWTPSNVVAAIPAADSAAKAAAALATNGGTPQDWLAPRPLDRDPLPLVAVPTTAGTGSEVTRSAVITDPARKLKLSLRDPRLAPRLALLDPELTVSVPPHVTAATGMDVLTHAVEAYTGRKATPVTDGLALHAVRLVAAHLEAAVRDGGDRVARTGMLMASLVAGMAFGNSDVAAVHCLAEALGGRYDTPHGVANAVFLPVVFAHTKPAAPARHADIAAALGLPVAGLAPGEAAARAAGALADLARAVGIPRLAELPGVAPADFPAIAAAAAANVSNPSTAREIDASGYEALLDAAWRAG
jgi:alcohol dehydrogenase